MEVSWAATREPAARIATCENFMVMIVIGDVAEYGKLVYVSVEGNSDEQEVYWQDVDYILEKPPWGPQVTSIFYAFR